MLHEFVQKAIECHSFEFSSYLWENEEWNVESPKAEGGLGSGLVGEIFSATWSVRWSRQWHHQKTNGTSICKNTSHRKKKCTKQDGVLSAASTIRERLYTTVNTDCALCINVCFKADHTNTKHWGNVNGMYIN